MVCLANLPAHTIICPYLGPVKKYDLHETLVKHDSDFGLLDEDEEKECKAKLWIKCDE